LQYVSPPIAPLCRYLLWVVCWCRHGVLRSSLMIVYLAKHSPLAHQKHHDFKHKSQCQNFLSGGELRCFVLHQPCSLHHVDLDGLLVLWDISVNDPLQEISSVFNGSITVAAWIPTERSNASAFVFCCATFHSYICSTCMRGKHMPICRNTHWYHSTVHFYLASITNAHDGPVEDIAFNKHSSQAG